jgi:putative GTP pyrophosphokinase
MDSTDYSKAFYLFEGINEGILSDETVKAVRSFIAAENLYVSATREIATKLENLNSEFKYTRDRNPIQYIQTRVKTPSSILRKLTRRGFDVSVESARKNLTDIAGVRVICSYINDIYLISDLLLSQDDIRLVRKSDYIQNPKPNGYRSLHLVVTVPVFLSTNVEYVNVEIQIRTIAMDFWAALEHELAYKIIDKATDPIAVELKACAGEIADIDKRMQNLYNLSVSKERKENPGN